MENILGLLRISVIRGINLAKRDVRSSDPYVMLRLGKQKLKTRVVNKNVNPEWNEELTLLINDDVPNIPIIIRVYDKDTFTQDDKMGEAEFDIGPFMEVVKLHSENVTDRTVLTTMKPNREVVKLHSENVTDRTVLTTMKPDRENCLAEESYIAWENGQVVQHMFLRLRNVECGEVELKLRWIGCSGSQNE